MAASFSQMWSESNVAGTSPRAAMLDREEAATKWRCKTKQHSAVKQPLGEGERERERFNILKVDRDDLISQSIN